MPSVSLSARPARRKPRPDRPTVKQAEDTLYPSTDGPSKTEFIRMRCFCRFTKEQLTKGVIHRVRNSDGGFEPFHKHFELSRSARLTALDERGLPYRKRGGVSSVTEPVVLHNPRHFNTKTRRMEEAAMAVVMYGLFCKAESKKGVGPVINGTQGWIGPRDLAKIGMAEGIHKFKWETFPAIAGVAEQFAFNVIRKAHMSAQYRASLRNQKTLTLSAFDISTACRLEGRPIVMGLDFPSQTSSKRRKIGGAQDKKAPDEQPDEDAEEEEGEDEYTETDAVEDARLVEQSDEEDQEQDRDQALGDDDEDEESDGDGEQPSIPSKPQSKPGQHPRRSHHDSDEDTESARSIPKGGKRGAPQPVHLDEESESVPRGGKIQSAVNRATPRGGKVQSARSTPRSGKRRAPEFDEETESVDQDESEEERESARPVQRGGKVQSASNRATEEAESARSIPKGGKGKRHTGGKRDTSSKDHDVDDESQELSPSMMYE